MNRFIDRYLGFTLNAVQSFWTYRFRMVIWILYDFIVLGVNYFLWTAIFSSSGGSLFGVSVGQYLAYVGLALMIGRLVATSLDGDIAEAIKRGDIAMNLVRPNSYFVVMASQQVGQTMGFVIAMIPLSVVVTLFIGLPPLTPWLAAAGALAILQAYILVVIQAFLLGILAFWITNYWGLFLFKQHIIALFSGEVIALNLLHQFAVNGIPNLPIPGLDGETMKGIFHVLWLVSYCLPFQAMSFTPSAILTGMVSGTDAVVFHLALQTLWIGLLGGLTSWVWSRAQHRITIMGG